MRDLCTVRSLIANNRRMKLLCGDYLVVVSSSDVQRFIHADKYNCVEILEYVFDESGDYYLQVMRMSHKVQNLGGNLEVSEYCYAAMVI